MDILIKLIAGVFVLWAIALLAGLLIALLPIILYAIGFILMLALLALIGRFVASIFC